MEFHVRHPQREIGNPKRFVPFFIPTTTTTPLAYSLPSTHHMLHTFDINVNIRSELKKKPDSVMLAQRKKNHNLLKLLSGPNDYIALEIGKKF